MEVRQDIAYTITLTEEEASALVSSVESVFKMFVDKKKEALVGPLLELKDAIILSANKG